MGALTYTGIRKTFGDVLASRQAIQWMIVDSEIDLRTARWLVLEAAHRAQSGQPFATEAALYGDAARSAERVVRHQLATLHAAGRPTAIWGGTGKSAAFMNNIKGSPSFPDRLREVVFKLSVTISAVCARSAIAIEEVVVQIHDTFSLGAGAKGKLCAFKTL